MAVIPELPLAPTPAFQPTVVAKPTSFLQAGLILERYWVNV